MKCPVCTEPLIVLEIDEIEIDHCTACGGVWLDSGELELLLEGAANRDALMATLKEGAGAEAGERPCPICSRTMDRAYYGEQRKVLLDICAEHHGIWFDRGELRDVMDMGDFPPSHRVYELIRETFSGSR